ncbi:tetratricopeptide repeat protein [Streptomyces sp. NPDC088725]|uniref:tetratricopeptide repeat protein n=1 Tax=Streptomyces sp. NPDC088725 TaxID=3365873 RepID=UPI0037F4A6BA
MLDPNSLTAIGAVLATVGAGMANEAGKWAWESAGGLVRRIAGREVPAPTGPEELAAVAELVHAGVRSDPALARSWSAFARSAPGPARADRVPVLPPSVRFFTNRQEPLKLLGREAARRPDGRPRVALVHGPAGIGTSTLAVHWGSKEAERFPDGQLYADLRGAAPGTAVDTAVVLRSLLVQLGLKLDDIPPSTADRGECFRDLVADRRLLVVLDHAHSSAQVRPLLTSARGVFTVVVAGRRLPGLDAVPVPVGPLTEKDARQLLSDLAGKEVLDAARDVLPSVLARCEGSPYALRAAVPLLTEPAPAGRPAAFAGDPVRGAAEDTYRGLAPEAARTYRLMSLIAWPAFGPAAVAHTVGVPEDEAVLLLGTLFEAGLLEQTETDRYRYRPQVRAHAEDLAAREDGIAACAAAMAATVEWYLRFAVRARLAALPQAWAIGPLYDALEPGTYRDPGHALSALRDELGNLVQAVRAAEELGRPEAVYQLCQALWPLQLKAGHHDVLLPALRTGARVADLHDAGSRMAGRMRSLLALDLMELRRYEEAGTELAAAARAEEQAGHRRGHASAVESLGLLRLRQWRFQEAYDCFEAAHTILAGVGPGDEGERDMPRAHALLERHRGRALRGLGRLDESRERLETALRFFRDTAESYNSARTLTDLAETRLDQGEAAAALRLIDEAISLLDAENAAHHLAHLGALRERSLSAGV